MSLDSSLGQINSAQLPEIGSLIADRYRILELVGKGGMGAVYRAEHVQLQRNVAVKMLLGDFDRESPAFKRFQQEARTASMLDHPNIVNVHDFGMLGATQAYLAMDFLAGRSLDEVLEEIFVLPLDRFGRIFSQACDALEHAHQEGVVHRDIKPSNLMLVQRGKDADFLKIVDFGLVKLMSLTSGEQKLTSSQTLVGSPLYMSPEQCRGLELDHRSDIYSLGCVMYRALSGNVPVMGESALDTLYKHVAEAPLPISQVNPSSDIPEALELVILKALAKNPDDRHQSMAELEEELQAALKGTAPVVPAASAAAPSPPLRTSSASNSAAGDTIVAPDVVSLLQHASGPRKAKSSIWMWIAPTLAVCLFGALILTSLMHIALQLKKHGGPTASISTQAPAPVATVAPVATAAKPVETPVVKPVARPVEQPKPKPVEENPAEVRERMKNEAALSEEAGDDAMAMSPRDLKSARLSYAKSLSLVSSLQPAGDQSAKLPLLGKLTYTCQLMRDLPAAMEYFRQFTELYRTNPSAIAGDTNVMRGVATTAFQLSELFSNRGNPDAASTYQSWGMIFRQSVPDMAIPTAAGVHSTAGGVMQQLPRFRFPGDGPFQGADGPLRKRLRRFQEQME